MGIGYKHGGSGGGTDLNFRVLGGTAQPTAPRENDIWVNTDADITWWAISTGQPTSLGEGGDTVTWDGNVEGETPVSSGEGYKIYMVKISDAVPSKDDLLNGYTIKKSDGTINTVSASEASSTVVEDGGGLAVSGEVFVIPAGQGFGAGIYVMCSVYTSSLIETVWISEFTINGYSGFASIPEGTVWIEVGAASDVAFNALKKNSIVIYPMEAQQYVGGSWMKVTAKSYQNGAWRDWWAGELYTPGNEFEGVTGGWTALALKQVSTGNASNPTVTRGEDGLVMTNSTTNYSGGIVYTAKKIDIKGRSNLVFTGVSNVSQKDRAALTIWSDIGSLQTDNVIANVALPTTEGSVSIDISALDGSYYVGFALYRSTSTTPTVTMRSLRMV